MVRHQMLQTGENYSYKPKKRENGQLSSVLDGQDGYLVD